MKPAIRMHELTYRLGDFVLGPLTCDVEQGRVIGLVGPNGSGKTTTLRCLAGSMYAHEGALEVMGRRASLRDGGWKQDTGYVPDRFEHFPLMTAAEHFRFLSHFYPEWNDAVAHDLTRRFRLDPGVPIRRLTPGNRTKVALVAALSHWPRVVLLDEPTAGLDPVVRAELFEVLVEHLESRDVTVLYATHIIDDLYRFADELIFLSRGRIWYRSDKDSLLETWCRLHFRYGHDLPHLPGAVWHVRHRDAVELITRQRDETLPALSSLGVGNVRQERMTLEEITVTILKES